MVLCLRMGDALVSLRWLEKPRDEVDRPRDVLG
jgi:hypothetical protein